MDIEGVITAAVTPFTKDGIVDIDSLKSLIRWLTESGVDGFCFLGTTGESPKLDRDERKKLMKHVIAEVKSTLPVIVGTGAITTRKAIQYTEDAKDMGATAALILPPWFFKYASDTLIEYYTTIAETTDFPVILYNLPSLVGYDIPIEVVVEVSKIPTVIGIKDSSANILYYQNLINQTPKEFNVIQGYGSLFFPSLLLGGRASINGDSNVAPKIVVDMYRSYRRGDIKRARELHYKLVDLISVILYGTFPVAIKEAMNLMGIQVGSILPPMTPLTAEEKKRLAEVLLKIGLVKK